MARQPVSHSSKALGVATFYSQFRLTAACEAHHPLLPRHRLPRVGRFAHLGGVEKHLGIQAGENTETCCTPSKRCTAWGPAAWLPVVMINDRAYGKLTPEKAVRSFEAFQAEVEGDGAADDRRDPDGAGWTERDAAERNSDQARAAQRPCLTVPEVDIRICLGTGGVAAGAGKC